MWQLSAGHGEFADCGTGCWSRNIEENYKFSTFAKMQRAIRAGLLQP